MIKLQILINYQNKENMSKIMNRLEGLNYDESKLKRPCRRTRLFPYQFGIEVLSLVYRLIRVIVEVVNLM